MTKDNQDPQITLNCFLIEATVKKLILEGIIDNKKLIENINNLFHPQTSDEMVAYSEAILYAKYAILN